MPMPPPNRPPIGSASSSQASVTARLIALQEDAAHVHVGGRGRVMTLQQQATAEQLEVQAAAKERDMLDALWTLQTLIADFGYDEVYTHVLQHLKPDDQGRVP
jgi:hypothetical protein